MLKEEIDRILSDYEKRSKAGDISPETLRACKSAFNKLRTFWGDLSPSEITKEKWSEFQDAAETKEPGASQFNQTKYFRILSNRLGILCDIKDRYSRRETSARRKRKNWIYSDEEIKALDAACRLPTERLFIRLGYLMGFRVSDVVRLSWDRIVIEGSAKIEFGGSDDKGHFIGRLGIPKSILEILIGLPRNGKWVFPLPSNSAKHLHTRQLDFLSIRNRAGIDRGTFHALRHYRLTKDVASGKPHGLICKFRRVSMKILMEHYLHPQDEEMRQMIEETK